MNKIDSGEYFAHTFFDVLLLNRFRLTRRLAGHFLKCIKPENTCRPNVGSRAQTLLAWANGRKTIVTFGQNADVPRGWLLNEDWGV